MLFVGSGVASSDTAEARLQIGYLDDQVYGEALFLVPLAAQDADDLSYAKFDAPTNPIWAAALPGMEEGALGEYGNLRGMLSQLASENRQATESSSAAHQQAVVAGWLSGTGGTLFLGLAFVVWFEPRWPRRARRPAA